MDMHMDARLGVGPRPIVVHGHMDIYGHAWTWTMDMDTRWHPHGHGHGHGHGHLFTWVHWAWTLAWSWVAEPRTGDTHIVCGAG